VFFISFEKSFKVKSQAANEYLFVFFNIKENDLKYSLKLIAILIYERIK